MGIGDWEQPSARCTRRLEDEICGRWVLAGWWVGHWEKAHSPGPGPDPGPGQYRPEESVLWVLGGAVCWGFWLAEDRGWSHLHAETPVRPIASSHSAKARRRSYPHQLEIPVPVGKHSASSSCIRR